LGVATDFEDVVRPAGTVFSMVSHLLHGDAKDPARSDEEQARVVVQPTDVVATTDPDELRRALVRQVAGR
jgi:hypothetical protein